MEDLALAIGNTLRPGEWIEFETNPYPAYMATASKAGVRPRGAKPSRIELRGGAGKHGKFFEDKMFVDANGAPFPTDDELRQILPDIAFDGVDFNGALLP